MWDILNVTKRTDRKKGFQNGHLMGTKEKRADQKEDGRRKCHYNRQ